MLTFTVPASNVQPTPITTPGQWRYVACKVDNVDRVFGMSAVFVLSPMSWFECTSWALSRGFNTIGLEAAGAQTTECYGCTDCAHGSGGVGNGNYCKTNEGSGIQYGFTNYGIAVYTFTPMRVPPVVPGAWQYYGCRASHGVSPPLPTVLASVAYYSGPQSDFAQRCMDRALARGMNVAASLWDSFVGGTNNPSECRACTDCDANWQGIDMGAVQTMSCSMRSSDGVYWGQVRVFVRSD